MRDRFRYLVFGVFFLIAPARADTGPLIAVSSDGTPIAYEAFGEGEPALLFVHGWCCDRSFWKKQVPYFEKKQRVIIMDLAGHGASGDGRQDYTMESFGDDVSAVVKAAGVSKVVLIGHSMGGAVIVEAAEAMPGKVAGVVGIDTLQDLEESYTAEQIEEFVRPFNEDFKKAAGDFVKGMFVPGTDPAFIADISNFMSGAPPRVGISALREMFKRSYVKDPPYITVPVWCLNADLWPTQLEANRKYLPQYDLVIMPGVGHFLMLEAPDTFNRELDAIIEKIVRAAGA